MVLANEKESKRQKLKKRKKKRESEKKLELGIWTHKNQNRHGIYISILGLVFLALPANNTRSSGKKNTYSLTHIYVIHQFSVESKHKSASMCI